MAISIGLHFGNTEYVQIACASFLRYSFSFITGIAETDGILPTNFIVLKQRTMSNDNEICLISSAYRFLNSGYVQISPFS